MALPTLTIPVDLSKKIPPEDTPSSGLPPSKATTSSFASSPSSGAPLPVTVAQEPFWKAYLNSPITFSFESEIKKAVRSCHNMQASPEAPVLRSLLKQCDGLLFLTVARAGFFLTGQAGSGLVLLKDSEGNWSAPACVGAVGGGVGLQAGGEVTDYVLFFKTEEAQEAMKGATQLVVGGSGGVAVGPLGRSGAWQYHWSLGKTRMACLYAFSLSKGWYAGGALMLQLLRGLRERNRGVYAREGEEEVAVADILGGKREPPVEARELYACLQTMTGGVAQ
ncbi:hypothetical protein NSK_005970 [Nannochloropsis salina CCMP1776]|uniref:Ysc84 actin-binding domain-containing protein n=1 Tax=Nannochloropsis salina CCMP1776 TaxID=1027361 RepID=A0A4D9CX83_9STRA|nr:hypothetical protein NSK_005970 [Nannochloropsis salina CCMP1776]|eukprot:TFJ82777.1 hypothetical protein NSK_005970 [Nannochloropsis salina CCMP1776]